MPVLHWTSCTLFNFLPTVPATYIKPNNTTTVNELPRICHQTAVTSTTPQTLAWSDVKDQSVSYIVLLIWGTRWPSCLKSTPDSVFGIFHWHNPSSRTIALGLTQHLTEISTRNISWRVKAAGAYGWQSYRLHVSTVMKSGSLNLLEPSRPVQACNGTALPLSLNVIQLNIVTCETFNQLHAPSRGWR